MRLSKKIAAVALAAVMSVSMLTACGGTDAPSSSNPGSSSSSSSSADSSASSSGSTSDSGSSSSSADSSSSSGSTDDKEENVDYKNSRTAKFYQKLGTSYTFGAKLDAVGNGQSVTGDMLVVTNGSRTYQQATTRSNGATESQTVLVDLTKQKGWALIPDERVKDQGKLGYCYSATISGTSIGSGIPGNVMPIEGLKFKQETKGNYYIETQTYELPTEEGKLKMVIAYYYAKYLDFETILNQYIDITDQINPSTVQALEPSIAGLTIG